MKKSVLNYGSFVSSQKKNADYETENSAKNANLNEKKSFSDDNLQELSAPEEIVLSSKASVEEPEAVPPVTVPVIEKTVISEPEVVQPVVDEPVMEIPSLDDILYAGEPESVRPKKTEPVANPSQEKSLNESVDDDKQKTAFQNKQIEPEPEIDFLSWEVPLYDNIKNPSVNNMHGNYSEALQRQNKKIQKQQEKIQALYEKEQARINKKNLKASAKIEKQNAKFAAKNTSENPIASETEKTIIQENQSDLTIPSLDVPENQEEIVTAVITEIPSEQELAEEKKSRKNKNKKSKKSEKNNSEKKKNMDSKNAVKRPIVVTLIAIISLIVIFSLVTVTAVVSKTTSEDTKRDAETQSRSQCSSVAKDYEGRLEGYISSVEMLYYLVDAIGMKNPDTEMTAVNSYEKEIAAFFEGNRDIGAVAFLSSNKTFINNKFFVSNEITPDLFDTYVLQNNEVLEQMIPGKINVENTTPLFGCATAAVFCTFVSGGKLEKTAILFSTETIQDNIASNPIYLSFLVNDKGEILVHPDFSVMRRGDDYSEHAVIRKMLSGKESNEQFPYEEVINDGKTKKTEEYIGAYCRTSEGGCAAITTVQTSIMLEGVRNTIRRNILLTIAILSFSVLIIWFFSTTLSSPLKKLTEVNNEINRGNFDTELFNDLKDTRKDEIGVLIRSVMAEREMLNTVTRLTNPDVTKAIVRNEIDFEAHLKDVTIFFSDIRGFTAISDRINARYGDKSAAVIIGFLNDYMKRMVNCIAITGGIVDKFEGDAIMAAWGVLRTDVSEYEKIKDEAEKKHRLERHSAHIVQDAVSAIKASMGMRYALMEYNKEADAYTKDYDDDRKPHVRIGAGINSGRVTVGFMGSDKYKLEHSSIGDAVNLASRTETSTKLCGVDMLITEDTYNLLKMDYIRCEENNYTIKEENLKNEITVEKIPVSFNVKGKGNQHFYGIVNMPEFDVEEFFKAENTAFANPDFKTDPDCLKAVGVNGPKSLNEVRELLGIPAPDFSKVNLNEHEEKIQIK